MKRKDKPEIPESFRRIMKKPEEYAGPFTLREALETAVESPEGFRIAVSYPEGRKIAVRIPGWDYILIRWIENVSGRGGSIRGTGEWRKILNEDLDKDAACWRPG